MIVADASIAAKWFVVESDRDIALRILGRESVMIAPDLILFEVAGALRRKVLEGELFAHQYAEATRVLPGFFTKLIPLQSLFDIASDLSMQIGHPIYDCSYLACAMLEKCNLVTADYKFADKTHRHGFKNVVVKLADWMPRQKDTDSTPDSSMLERVLTLHRQFEQTLESVRLRVARPLGSSTIKVTSTKDLIPAFDSPAYIRLSEFILSLSKADRAKLLALGWLGQGQSGDDWSLVLDRAEAYLSEDPRAHLSYLISKIPLFEKGIERLEAFKTTQSLTTPQDGKV